MDVILKSQNKQTAFGENWGNLKLAENFYVLRTIFSFNDEVSSSYENTMWSRFIGFWRLVYLGYEFRKPQQITTRNVSLYICNPRSILQWIRVYTLWDYWSKILLLASRTIMCLKRYWRFEREFSRRIFDNIHFEVYQSFVYV